MEVSDIRAAIRKGENEEIEFKESIGHLQSISKAACSFANSRGGVIFIGVNDNGDITGLEMGSDAALQKLSSINDVVYPSPVMNIEKHDIDKKRIFILIIQRPDDNIYYTFKGAIYVRIGSTTRRLEGQSQLEFLRRRQILSFDESSTSGLSIDDIDEQKVMEYLESRGRKDFFEQKGLEEFLLNSRLARNKTNFTITNAAILIFGKDPTEHFPQVELKLVRFSGIEPVNIIDYQLIQDDIINTIEKSISFILRNVKKEVKLDGSLKRKEVFEYPPDVIREAIVNAVAHRDYFSKDSIQISIFDDRMEITNPGSIPSELDRELFGTISIQRNHLLYRFLRDLGYIEGLGTGIPRMKESMRDHGLNDPEFLIMEYFFKITLRNEMKKNIINPRQEEALKFLSEHGRIQSDEYSRMFDVSITTAVKDLNELIQRGHVRKVGVYKGAYYEMNDE